VNKTITPYGLLQGYVNLYDTTRQNDPDFFQYITRFGLKVSEGIAKAQFELNVNGNKAEGGKKGDEADFNSVTIRRADVGLDLPSKTSVRFGRYRIGNPEVWGVDATTTLDGFGGSDGVMVSQGIDISEGNSLTLKLGVANSLSSPLSENYAYGEKGSSTDDGIGWNTNSKAILAAVDVKIAGVSAGVYFGTDGKRKAAGAKTAVVASDGPDGRPDTGDDVDASPAIGETYRATTHLEASLGYNIDGLGGGVAYQSIQQGDTKTYTNENGKLKSGQTVTKGKDTATILSLGVNGDSTLFGLTGIAQTGDKLTYGASYSLSTARNSEAKGAVKDALEDADVSQFVVAGGYNAGGFTLELDVGMESTKGKTFSNEKGDKKEKSRTFSYITGLYVF
jgi:hypothetical protein